MRELLVTSAENHQTLPPHSPAFQPTSHPSDVFTKYCLPRWSAEFGLITNGKLAEERPLASRRATIRPSSIPTDHSTSDKFALSQYFSGSFWAATDIQFE